MDKDINTWKQRNEILHKKVNRQMDEIKKLHKESETIFDLARRFPNKTYRELEKYRDADRQEEAQQISPIEINWKKRAQEAEGEMSILKGIETNRVKEAQAKSNQLQDELDRVKKDNNDLFLRIAELTEVEESHRNMNGKLQERLTEVEEDNKKLSNQIWFRSPYVTLLSHPSVSPPFYVIFHSFVSICIYLYPP